MSAQSAGSAGTLRGGLATVHVDNLAGGPATFAFSGPPDPSERWHEPQARTFAFLPSDTIDGIALWSAGCQSGEKNRLRICVSVKAPSLSAERRARIGRRCHSRRVVKVRPRRRFGRPCRDTENKAQRERTAKKHHLSKHQHLPHEPQPIKLRHQVYLDRCRKRKGSAPGRKALDPLMEPSGSAGLPPMSRRGRAIRHGRRGRLAKMVEQACEQAGRRAAVTANSRQTPNFQPLGISPVRHSSESFGRLLQCRAYSITSSAIASSASGIVSPSAFAVPPLITSSNFVARTTGRSAGLAPLRMRPA